MLYKTPLISDLLFLLTIFTSVHVAKSHVNAALVNYRSTLLGIDDNVKALIGRKYENERIKKEDLERSKLIDYPFVGALVRKEDKSLKCAASFCTLRHLITSCSCVVEVTLLNVTNITWSSLQLSRPEDYSIVPGYNMEREFGIKWFKEYPGCHFYPRVGIWEHDFGFVEVESHFETLLSINNIIPFSTFLKDGQVNFMKEYKSGKIENCFTVSFVKNNTNSSQLVRLTTKLTLIRQDECYTDLCKENNNFCNNEEPGYICAKMENISTGAPVICQGQVRGMASQVKNYGNLMLNVFISLNDTLEQVHRLAKNAYSTASIFHFTYPLLLLILII